MTSPAPADAATLERRRRLALRFAAGAALTAAVAFPAGMATGGSESAETVAGALLMAGIAGAVAAPWTVRGWQSFMRRRMVAAAVAARTDVRYVDGENDRAASGAALASDGFVIGTFLDSGLVEPFTTAAVHNVLVGDAGGIPFALAELALLDDKGYRMFGGVLASFRLARPRPGLTIVARDRGLLGNLVARAGSRLERLPLEDPEFEGIFEAYGDNQVGGRVILTTTMLERLKALDEHAHAAGFACAFVGGHLLLAFSGMRWTCPAWRIVQPVGSWLPGYTGWLAGLMDLPRDIVRTLNLAGPQHGNDAGSATRHPAYDATRHPADDAVGSATRHLVPAPLPSQPHAGIAVDSGSGQVFSSTLWRLVGEGGMALIYVASGALFGGVALLGAWYGITEGYSAPLFWYFWGLIIAGVVYGAYAIGLGVRQLALLAWRWNAPLRTMRR